MVSFDPAPDKSAIITTYQYRSSLLRHVSVALPGGWVAKPDRPTLPAPLPRIDTPHRSEIIYCTTVSTGQSGVRSALGTPAHC